VARPAEVAQSVLYLRRPLVVDEIAGNCQGGANAPGRDTELMQALRIRGNAGSDVVLYERVPLLRDVLFEAPNLRVGAAFRNVHERPAEHNVPEQGLDPGGHSRSVLHRLDHLTPGGGETPPARSAVGRQLELEPMPLEQEVARVVERDRRGRGSVRGRERR